MRIRYVLTVVLTLCAWLSGQDPAEAVPELDTENATALMAEARETLAALPQDAEEGTPDALKRAAWERRVQLLEEGLALLARAAGQAAASAELETRRQAYVAQAAEHAALQPVSADVASPMEAGLAGLEQTLATLRERVASLRSLAAEKERYVEQIPTLLAQSRTRLQAAQERGDSLSRERDATTDPAGRQLLETRASNADIDAQVARLESRVLERDRELEQDLAPLRADEQGLAERRLARQEGEYEVYREALARELERAGQRLDRELLRLEREFAAAQGPAEQFFAAKRLAIARFASNEGAHERFLMALRADLAEQSQRLAVEVGELSDLRDFLERSGTGELAGQRVKFTMQRVKLRRQALERTLKRDVAAELGDYRSRRLVLENELFFLQEAWALELETTAARVPGAEADALRDAAGGLLDAYEGALRGERDALTTLIGAGQELQVALIQRRDALEALEAFIRSKVFWIRDAKPLGTDLWPRVRAEADVVAGWAQALGSGDDADSGSTSVTRPPDLLLPLLLMLALASGLTWLRQRLRRFVTAMNDRTVQNDAGSAERLLALGAGVLSVALLPVLLFVASRSLDGVGLPARLVPVLGAVLEHLAVFFLFWFLSRSFFARRGTAQVQFGMDRDAAHGLHRALGILLFGYLAFFTSAAILARPPFALGSQPLEALPRLAHTAFLVTAVVAAIVLLRPRSAFSRSWAAALGDNVFGRRWPALAGLLCLVGVGLVALDVMGFRYGAGVLAANLAASLVALLVLVPIYKGAVVALTSRTRARRAKRVSARAPGAPSDADSAPEPGADDEQQFRTVLRIVIAVGGAFLIAAIWGLDAGALDTLDLQPVYDIRDTGEIDEFVSVLDLLQAMLYLAGTYFLLKYLPGIYEYGFFSRLALDSGLKYAILTISRYAIFTVGVIAILGAFHLDLSRLGWLMAAMGVGLGFGLQEIVSNFVSGIILLVERPVRVGDVVTVGGTSGRVQRINIRATSVINFDRQEIIVPNRSLITQEVTNWTRGDTIIRLVVPIGVAYGCDVDLVTSTLLEIAREQPEILAVPEAQALFLAHGESSLDFELRVFVPDPSVKLTLLHRLNRSINRRLAELDIEIPFPQRDLHIRSSSVSWPPQDQAAP